METMWLWLENQLKWMRWKRFICFCATQWLPLLRATVHVDENENTVIEEVGGSLKLVVKFKYKLKTFMYQLLCRILHKRCRLTCKSVGYLSKVTVSVLFIYCFILKIGWSFYCIVAHFKLCLLSLLSLLFCFSFSVCLIILFSISKLFYLCIIVLLYWFITVLLYFLLVYSCSG